MATEPVSATPLVRDSTPEDVRALAEIYGHYVLQSTATFEFEPPDADEMARRREAAITLGLPHLVLELDGQVTGFAYATPYRSRAGYRFSIEDSLYIDRNFVGKGLGGLLLAELIRRCEVGPWRQMIAVIGGSDNAASIRLHAKFSFRQVGTLRAVGYKFGKWIDTVLMQRALGRAED